VRLLGGVVVEAWVRLLQNSELIVRCRAVLLRWGLPSQPRNEFLVFVKRVALLCGPHITNPLDLNLLLTSSVMHQLLLRRQRPRT